MRSEDEIRRMAERLEDVARFANPPSFGVVPRTPMGKPESDKAWRARKLKCERKARALRWALGEEVEP